MKKPTKKPTVETPRITRGALVDRQLAAVCGGGGVIVEGKGN